MGMTLEQLRVLAKVVEAGSFARAADLLDMQRSNVSRVIAQLEAGLGVTLLERTTRTQSVTEAGKAVYERAVGVLEAIADAVRVTQQIQEEPRGLLRVACAVEFGMAAVSPWVEAYLARHPRVTAQVEYASRELDLVHEGFDLAIRGGPLPPSRLVARLLGHLGYGLFASPDYLRRRGTPRQPADLQGHDLVVLTGEGIAPTWTLQRGRRREQFKAAAAARLRVNAGAGVHSALLRGLGIGLLPDLFADQALRQGHLVNVLAQWRGATLPLYAVYPSNRYLTPKVRAFVDLAVEQFPGLRAGGHVSP